MEKETAIDAWLEWKDEVDFEKDVDSGSHRLLPLVYQKLNSFNYSDDLVLGRVKGIYKHFWITNQQLFYKTRIILQKLQDAGIETAVIKGLALTSLVYRNNGIRPMTDTDIIVPRDKALAAIDVFSQAGFYPKVPDSLQRALHNGAGMAFIDADNSEIDLHWEAIKFFRQKLNIFDDSVDTLFVDISGIHTLTFNLSDHLLQTILHGVYKNSEPPIRWVADAVLLINKEENGIDWSRLIEFSREFRGFIQVRDALLYLNKNFNVCIPAEVIETLNSLKPTYADRVVAIHAVYIGSGSQKFRFLVKTFSFYAFFLKQSDDQRFFSMHVSFIGHAWRRIVEKLFGSQL